MIKIEITDLSNENNKTLVKLAAFLLECAGHGVAQVSEENFNKHMMKQAEKIPLDYCLSREVDENLLQQCAREYLAGEPPLGDIDVSQPLDLSKCTGMGILKPKPPVFDLAEKGRDRTIEYTLNVNELPGIHGHGECSTPYQHCSESNLTTAVLEDSQGNQFEVKGVTDVKDLEMRIGEPIVAEKKKSATKRKRTPSKVEDELINYKEYVDVQVSSMPMPPIEAIAPPPPVNGNTIMDKILKAIDEHKLTHADITAIVVKHGLKATRDIFINDHLIPVIDADIDEALRGK